MYLLGYERCFADEAPLRLLNFWTVKFVRLLDSKHQKRKFYFTLRILNALSYR